MSLSKIVCYVFFSIYKSPLDIEKLQCLLFIIHQNYKNNYISIGTKIKTRVSNNPIKTNIFNSDLTVSIETNVNRTNMSQCRSKVI